MGREIHRVPADFNWPLNKVWHGYLMPDRFAENECPDCDRGYSPHAQRLYEQWYGNAPFDPASTGSTLLRHDTPAVRDFAERNVTRSPEYYGTGEQAIVREAQRLANLWNGQWCHHLAQDDVDALLDADRLWEFTRKVVPGKGWQKIEPSRPTPTAAQVNEWSLRGFGHDSLNAGVVIRARCKREGIDDTCATCHGHGSIEAYPGQRAEAEAWERTDPPEGEGWQLWETVTEGSPISPVFDSPEGLAAWMASPAYTWGASKHSQLSYQAALGFVQAGWAPTAVASASTGVVTGEEFVGQHETEER